MSKFPVPTYNTVWDISQQRPSWSGWVWSDRVETGRVISEIDSGRKKKLFPSVDSTTILKDFDAMVREIMTGPDLGLRLNLSVPYCRNLFKLVIAILVNQPISTGVLTRIPRCPCKNSCENISISWGCSENFPNWINVGGMSAGRSNELPR